jgi:hypothetical protein
MNRTGHVSYGWNFNNSTRNESVLKPLCEQVEQYFPLPIQRLHRYFATTDEEYFREPTVFGEHYRGMSCSSSAKRWLPPYLLQCFFADDSFANAVAFDAMIYIRLSKLLEWFLLFFRTMASSYAEDRRLIKDGGEVRIEMVRIQILYAF